MQKGQTSCRDTGRTWLSASQGEAWNRAFSDRPQKGQPCQHLDFVLLVFRKWSNRFLLFEPLSLWVVLCYGNPTKVGWRKQWHPTPVLLPGKSHGWRSLVGCSPWGRWVRHDWATLLSLFTFMHWRRQWHPTPVFLPGESQGQGSLVGCRLWGRTESDTTEAT